MTQCNTMEDVRAEVDRLDREIVRLLAERELRIADAGRIKPQRDLVRDEGRIEDVIAKVRILATENGANPDLIEAIYRDMMEHFIAHEFTLWDANRGF